MHYNAPETSIQAAIYQKLVISQTYLTPPPHCRHKKFPKPSSLQSPMAHWGKI